jgi:WhiB family redox-sensing transcriptional regulator
MTTQKKPATTASRHGGYDYVQLLSEWILEDTDNRFMKDAACKGLDRDMFFPERGANTSIKKAKEVCAVCPVREECLRFAMNNRIDFGVWGGVSANQRIRNARKAWRKTA